MPVAPPHGSKLTTNCWIAWFTPMVASAKNAPRSRRMPRPNSSATALTATPPAKGRRDHIPIQCGDEIEANVAAEPEEDDVAEIDVAGVEGEFLDTVCGIPYSRTEIVMLRASSDGGRLELARFVRPDSVPGSPAAMANELGLRNVSFEVNELQAAVDWAATEGYGLVGGIGEYESAWRMAYVRGPEGIVVSLFERIG